MVEVLAVFLTWQQFSAGHGSCSVTLVLDESEASVLGLVSGAGVHDDVHHPVGDLFHLRQDLLAFLGFGNPAHKQTAVVDAGTNSEEATVPEAQQSPDAIKTETAKLKELVTMVTMALE